MSRVFVSINCYIFLCCQKGSLTYQKLQSGWELSIKNTEESWYIFFLHQTQGNSEYKYISALVQQRIIKDFCISLKITVQCVTYMENAIRLRNCKYPKLVSLSTPWEVWKPIGVPGASVYNQQLLQQQSKWHRALNKSIVILLVCNQRYTALP